MPAADVRGYAKHRWRKLQYAKDILEISKLQTWVDDGVQPHREWRSVMSFSSLW